MIQRADRLAAYLSEFINQEATVADIGGGSGSLSYAMSDRGFNVDLFEPSLSVATFNNYRAGRVRIINSFFNPRFSKYDLIVIKQVLEHVDDPGKMLREIFSALRDGGAVYVEVPSFEWICQHNSVVDFHYQHVSYFSESSVEYFTRKAGFEIEDKRSLLDGHDIGYVLRKWRALSEVKALAVQPSPHMQVINAERFSEVYAKGQRLARLLQNNQIALYGANAYMQAFIGLFGRNLFKIKHIFDDSPVSHGKYVVIPGTVPYYVEITPPPLSGSDVWRSLSVIVICCYLHDEVVLQKLRYSGYGGRVYSLRPSSLRRNTDPASFFH
jgi:SAM-dependent methyltransferase